MIEKYYTQTIIIYTNSRTKTNGVVKDNLVLAGSILGRLNPATTGKYFVSDKVEYDYTHILFSAPSSLLKPGKVVRYESVDYDVISVLNPFSKDHHYETLLKARI